MIRALATFVLLLVSIAAVANEADSVWVKVPLAAVDSVWIRVPVTEPAARVSAAGTADIATDTMPVTSAPVAMPDAGAMRHAWSRKQQDDPRRVIFSWGAEAGSSIDMSEHDMSSVDFNATFGLRYRWINFAGVGAGAHIMVSNSCRTYPVFAVFRTDFSGRIKFLFLDLRGGAALNLLPNNVNQTDAYGAVAVGFMLSTGKTFRGYITAGYTYVGRRNVTYGERIVEYGALSMASIRLGISF